MTMGAPAPEEIEKQSAFSRTLHSIRTRCSLATAVFLLAALAVFYVGGRIVLVHLMRETEEQVKEIGLDISRIACRNAELMRKDAVDGLGPALGNAKNSKEIMAKAGPRFSLVARFSAAGAFADGVVRSPDGAISPIAAPAFEQYAEAIAKWSETTVSHREGAIPTGIVSVGGAPHYVSMICCGGGCVMLGQPFETEALAEQINKSFAGMAVRVTDRRAKVKSPPAGGSVAVRQDGEQEGFGIAPMISEAISFYSGGFWKFGGSPFEAVFAIRDISGTPVSMVSVSVPTTFRNVTRAAIGRYAFFIAIGGIILVLPVFLLQGHMFLNPLTRMTREVSSLGRDGKGRRLKWKGKDEFALLAASVNGMLDAIDNRSDQVKEAEARQQALLECVPDALAVFDPLGRLVSVGKEGEGVDPMPGMRLGAAPSAEIYGQQAVESFLSALDETFRTGRVGKVKLVADGGKPAKKDETPRHFELRISRLAPRSALAVIRDVTEEAAEHKFRAAAEERISDSKKRESLTLLAAGIAHDMNNVLSVILNAAEAEVAHPSGNPADVLVTVRDAVRRGSSMMRELRTFAGESRVVLHRISPSAILDDMQILVKQMLSKNVILTITAVSGIPKVDADPNQIWKVFFNIIKNAGEAIGPRPGHVTVTASLFRMTPEAATTFRASRPLPPGRGVLFTIADDGPGISPEILPRLFDPYVSSKAVGRGLGLATVRTIIEAHDGGIRVNSEVERGTVFEIYLPESRISEQAAARPAEPRKDGCIEGGEVLVVDDDESILKTSATLLKALKLVPYVARDNIEALSIVRRHSSALRAIILDASFGEVDTVRLLGAFRASAPSVPVIVSTGSSEERIREFFATEPFDAFLAKPYTLKELGEVISNVRREI